MLVYRANDIVSFGHTDSDFQADKDERKSTSRYVLTLSRGDVSWKSTKQDRIANSIIESKYGNFGRVRGELAPKFPLELGVVPNMDQPMDKLCDNNNTLSQCKEPRNHRKGKHIKRKYYLIRDFVQKNEIMMEHIFRKESSGSLYQAFSREGVQETLICFRGKELWARLVFIV